MAPTAGYTAFGITTNLDFHAIWGRSENDVFVVGDGGARLHWNGADWSNASQSQNLRGVWGDADGRVYAVGIFATVHRWDGNEWSPLLRLSANGAFSGVVEAGGVWWIVGNRGSILRSTP